MSQESNIRGGIKTLLDALVTAGTLKEVQYDDFKKSLFDRNIAAFPAAIISTASVSSDCYTNRENLRVYEYQILVLDKVENVASTTQIEDLRELVFNKFDDNPTLGGLANGGVEPAMSAAEISDNNSCIMFMITIKAKALYARA